MTRTLFIPLSSIIIKGIVWVRTTPYNNLQIHGERRVSSGGRKREYTCIDAQEDENNAVLKTK